MVGIVLRKIQCEIGDCCIGESQDGEHNKIFQVGNGVNYLVALHFIYFIWNAFFDKNLYNLVSRNDSPCIYFSGAPLKNNYC